MTAASIYVHSWWSLDGVITDECASWISRRMRISTTAAETLTTYPERGWHRANEMNITLELHFALAMLGTVGYFFNG
jgi:hypothetical protein